jgi:hypothetical protein
MAMVKCKARVCCHPEGDEDKKRDDPVLLKHAQAFLRVSSQQAEPPADLSLAWEKAVWSW